MAAMGFFFRCSAMGFFFFVDLDGWHKCIVALLYSLKIACLVLILGLF